MEAPLSGSKSSTGAGLSMASLTSSTSSTSFPSSTRRTNSLPLNWKNYESEYLTPDALDRYIRRNSEAVNGIVDFSLAESRKKDYCDSQTWRNRSQALFDFDASDNDFITTHALDYSGRGFCTYTVNKLLELPTYNREVPERFRKACATFDIQTDGRADWYKMARIVCASRYYFARIGLTEDPIKPFSARSHSPPGFFFKKVFFPGFYINIHLTFCFFQGKLGLNFRYTNQCYQDSQRTSLSLRSHESSSTDDLKDRKKCTDTNIVDFFKIIKSLYFQYLYDIGFFASPVSNHSGNITGWLRQINSFSTSPIMHCAVRKIFDEYFSGKLDRKIVTTSSSSSSSVVLKKEKSEIALSAPVPCRASHVLPGLISSVLTKSTSLPERPFVSDRKTVEHAVARTSSGESRHSVHSSTIAGESRRSAFRTVSRRDSVCSTTGSIVSVTASIMPSVAPGSFVDTDERVHDFTDYDDEHAGEGRPTEHRSDSEDSEDSDDSDDGDSDDETVVFR